jgi:hypothetical protein
MLNARLSTDLRPAYAQGSYQREIVLRPNLARVQPHPLRHELTGQSKKVDWGGADQPD